jgi:RNA polymerase sigma-70 factor (ECF subfamily)
LIGGNSQISTLSHPIFLPREGFAFVPRLSVWKGPAVDFPASGDRLLIHSLQRGDPDAWGRLCDLYGDALYRYAYHRSCGDAHLAEDIRQDTLLAAADAIRTFRGDAPLFGWLCAIARRKIADEIRRIGRQSDLPDDDESGPAAAWRQLRGEPSPEEWLQRAEHRGALIEALWSIPKSYRDVLLRRYVDGLSVDDVARQAGCSYKAAESLLSRARSALRATLAEVESD